MPTDRSGSTTPSPSGAQAGTEPAPRRPLRHRNPRGQGARLRDEVITGAAALLERTGSEESISMRAVALEIGVTPPSVALHFHDRAEIIDAVVAVELGQLAAQMAEAIAVHQDPVDQLFAAVRAYYNYGNTHPNRYRVIFERRFLPLWAEEQRIMELTAPMIGTAFGVVVDIVQRCIDTGRSTSTNAFDATVAVWLFLHGLVALPHTITSFPWPDVDHLLVTCVTRLAELTANPHPKKQ